MTAILPDMYAADHRHQLEQAIRRHVTKPDPDAAKHRRKLERALGIQPPKKKLPPKSAEQKAADWLEDIEWLISNGVRAADIATRMGATINTISRRLHRNNRGDLATHFQRYL